MAGSARFEVDMALNASGVAKGAQDGKKALADLEAAVEGVADESQKSGNTVDSFADKVTRAAREAGKSDDEIKDALRSYGVNAKDAERAIERIGDEGKRAGDKLEDALRDAARVAKDLGDTGRDAGRDVERGMKRAEDGVDEFKDEANSTAREAAASFDGSAESIADAFQEVAANAFAGFGPAGAVAGLAAAAGIGLAVAGFEATDEAAQASRERASEWAQSYVEAGGKVLSAATTTALALDIATDEEKFKKATDNAKAWGVDVSVAIAAMAGETWALTAANDALSIKEQEAADEAVKLADGGEALADMLVGATSEARAGRDALDLLTKEMDLGGQQADAYSRYLAQVAQNTEGATRKTDEFGDTVAELPDGTTIYIDAETGQATTDTEKIKDKIYGIRDKNVNISVHTSTGQADAELDRLWRRWNGREVRLNGRVVSNPHEGWDR